MTDRATPQSRQRALGGLYLILDAQYAPLPTMLDILRAAGRHGVRLVQYRFKQLSMSEAYAHARELSREAKASDVMLIINDRCDLALAVEAAGVHLGQSDLPVAEARKLLGPRAVIGLSTHRVEEILGASKTGVDYLGFGPIFPTGTKSDHEPPVGVEAIRQAREVTEQPIFAIGGITPETVGPICRAGANGVAVSAAVLKSTDPEQVIVQFLHAFPQSSPPAW